MWLLITTLLCLTCANAFQNRTTSTYPPFVIEDRILPDTYSFGYKQPSKAFRPYINNQRRKGHRDLGINQDFYPEFFYNDLRYDSPLNNIHNTVILHNDIPNNKNYNNYIPNSRPGARTYTQGDTGIYQNIIPDIKFYKVSDHKLLLNDIHNTVHNFNPNNNYHNNFSPKSRFAAGSYAQGDTRIHQNVIQDNNIYKVPDHKLPLNNLHNFDPNYNNFSPRFKFAAGSYAQGHTGIYQNIISGNNIYKDLDHKPPLNNIIHNFSPRFRSGAGSNVFSYRRTNNAPQSRRKDWYMDAPFDVKYFYKSPVINLRNYGQSLTYVEDLKRINLFGKYLLYRTETDLETSDSLDDAIHQYNALFTVLISLAQAIRNSCDDFEPIYEQVYYPTIDKYYHYGLVNAYKVPGIIKDYIDKGASRMPKLRKLVLEFCATELHCSESIEEYIKSSPHAYIKELETLEALSHLASSFYPYIDEFDQAANNGTVLEYLKNSQDRLKEYVKHMVNSVDHLTDSSVTCD